MTNAGTTQPSTPHARGFTLLELMVALTLALLLGIAVVAMMGAASNVRRAQNGARRIADNARYALEVMTTDIRNTAHQYCLNYAGPATAFDSAVVYVDQVRSLKLLFDATGAPWGLGTPGSAVPYLVDPAEFVLGSECNRSACVPDPAGFRPLAVATTPFPAIGIADGARAGGADVLSLRYLRGNGLAIGAVGGTPPVITPAPGVAVPATFSAHALLTDCGTALAAQVSRAGGGLQIDSPVAGDLGVIAEQARVFDLDNDLVAVTYYLRLRRYQPPGGAPARLVSTLVRRLNGVDVELAQGVERLDFRYYVERDDGSTSVLAADEVNDVVDHCRGAALGPGAPAAVVSCGWRSLKGIEIYLLANSVDDVIPGEAGSANSDAFRYPWLVTGAPNLADAYESPAAIGTLPNGLPPGRMLRRTFRTFVALRGYNH